MGAGFALLVKLMLAAAGEEPQDIVEMHWHETGWMPPANDAEASHLTTGNKKQEPMANKVESLSTCRCSCSNIKRPRQAKSQLLSGVGCKD